KTFGASVVGTYEVGVDACDTRTRVSVLHCPSGERDDYAWHVSPFEIVGPSSRAEAEQPDRFPPPPQESATRAAIRSRAWSMDLPSSWAGTIHCKPASRRSR